MPLGPKGNPYYTKEQLLEARKASALEYAKSRGYDLVAEGAGYYYLREHDSMVFRSDGRWWWNSRQQKGRALDFMMIYEGKTLTEAVLILTNDPAVTGGQSPEADYRPKAAEAPPRPFVLPERADSTAQLYRYLCGKRKLDRDIVAELIQNGRLYQSKKQLPTGRVVYNAAFVGMDDTGKPRYAFQRSLQDGKPYKIEVSGSDRRWPFVMPAVPLSSGTLILFESAIDAISEATIAKAEGRDWQRVHRLPTGGNYAPETVMGYLTAHPEIQRVGLGFDNDAGGQGLVEYTAALLRPMGLSLFPHQPPRGKDWNQYLTMYYRKERNP